MSVKAKRKGNPVLFGTDINGYNKKDVNNYIAESDAEQARKCADYEQHITSLIESHTREIYERDNIIDKLRADIKEANKQNATLAEQKMQCEQHEKMLEETLNQENRTANEPKVNNYEDVDEYKRKAGLYDAMCKMPSDVLTGQAITANNLIQSAQKEAEEIRREAQTELEVARENIRQNSESAMKDIFTLIDHATDESIEELLNTVHEAEYGASQLSVQVTARNRDSAARINYIRSVLESKIKKRLTEIGMSTSNENSGTRNS